ncbi:MAG: response regulator [Nitrospirota bacterium]|nr:response regulator [Nitrospirota bacterium]
MSGAMPDSTSPTAGSPPSVGWRPTPPMVFGALLTGVLLFAVILTERARTSHVPQLMALSKVRFEVAAAHILLEEITGGDLEEATSQMNYHLRAASDSLSALRNGGRIEAQRIHPLNGAAAAALVSAIAHLEDVRAISEQRVGQTDAGAGSALDRKLDRAYFAYLAEVDRASSALLDSTANRIHIARLIGFLSILGTVLAGGAAFSFRSRRQRGGTGAFNPESPADQDVREEMALLAATVDQASEIILITDREARILYVNHAFTRLIGYLLEEVRGQYAEVLRSPQHEADFYEDLFFDLSAGTPWRGTLFYRRKDGADLETEAAITPIRGRDGTVTHMVSVARDVTREKTLQAQMEHMQRLESLGVLAGGIAHDFNNILTSIMGSAGLARLHASDDPKMDDYLERIETSSERAADLCRQMLAYSGRGTLQTGPLDLTATVTEMSRLMEASVPKHIALVRNLAPGLPPVSGDRGQLSQVVMNLLINAQEAIGDATGTIRLTTGTVQAGEELLAGAAVGADMPPGNYVLLEVADTGCGMDPETKKRLFDPFFTTKFTGRGLGMSALMGIVRAHRGAVLVSSQPGHGTTFRVLLPTSDLTPIPPQPTDHQPTWRGSGVVLVVDDEEPVRRVAEAMLGRLGFDTLTARDGQEGVDLVERNPNGLVCVLLDMTMPRMNGTQALERIHVLRPTLPVLMVSGFSAADAGEFTRVDHVAFLQKPFSAADLEKALRTLLDTPPQ